MGIIGKAIAYKVVKNRAERKAEDRIRAELEYEYEICDHCGKPRNAHTFRKGKYRC
jgi:hypothetical protein